MIWHENAISARRPFHTGSKERRYLSFSESVRGLFPHNRIDIHPRIHAIMEEDRGRPYFYSKS